MQGKSPQSQPLVLIKAERNTATLMGDLLDLADKMAKDFIPMAKDDKVGRGGTSRASDGWAPERLVYADRMLLV